MDHLSKKEVQEMASQLRSPEGQQGVDMGRKMHETNINMTMAAVDALKLAAGDHILEIGHGNAAHAEQILGRASGIQYTGLDISQTMQEEAQRINASFIDQGQASFHLYGGTTFPFPDDQFHKIMTVNTIYFWEHPLTVFNEAHRVLTSGGLFSIVFAQKSFMKQLPFVEYGFRLYDTDDIRQLVEKISFKITGARTQTEEVESKDGSKVERTFTTITLKG